VEIPLILAGLLLRNVEPRLVSVWRGFLRDGRNPALAASRADELLSRTRISSANWKLEASR
jgi:hypothetical protein